MWRWIKRRIKWGFQRVTRGFSDRQLWNIDYELAKWILPRLKAWRAKGPTGFPIDLSEKYPDDGTGYQAWLDVLDKMIFAFNEIVQSDCSPGHRWEDGSWKYEEERWKKIEEGLNLFREYYWNLWD